MKWLRNNIDRFEKPFTILVGSVALTAALMNLAFKLLEANLYDLRMAHGIQAAADPRIALITIDDATAKALGEFQPLPLDVHARFLEALEKLDPKGVGYLIDMNQAALLNPEQLKGPSGRRFVDAARSLEAKGSAFLVGTPYDVTGEVVPPFPLSKLPHAIAIIHKDGNVFSEDKVTRRALVALDGKPAFHLDLARRLGLVGPNEVPPGTYDVPEIDAKYFLFRYHGDPEKQPYERISFLDVLNGKLVPGALKGRIVLVGKVSKEDSSDFAYTPFSKTAFTSPKLALHATILDSVVHREGILRAPRWADWAVTFAAVAFVLWWVLTSTPLQGVFATLTLIAAFALLAQALFAVFGIWVRESQPLVGIFVGYYLAVPYRLIREYKTRWEYQRKNEILTQVEELKTNFLSLVTHDLKTPVARIQGLAEVLLRKSDHLLARDRETLHHIVDSTDELNRFISSILELSKVESNRLQLNLESRDINQLIERAVDGFEATARARGIEIVTDLEPLFPVKIDASLMSKVINNLIDNALKYSPSGSTVTVQSREAPGKTASDGWISISIRDQGIGLSEEERASLFTRFYRAKNDTTTRVSGTGLGLYLTKFFVEAHAGRVDVESAKDEGSVFSIHLPIDGGAATGLTRVVERAVKDQEWKRKR